MTRYLTPSKIGLLALAVLITEGVIPNESVIPIISFIIYRILPQLATDCDAHGTAEPAPLTMTMLDFEAAIKPLASVVTGRNIMDKFLEKLWSLNNLHTMHEFFRELNHIMLTPRAPGQPEVEGEELSKNKVWVHRASPIGMFMRRCHVEFFRLQFDDLVKLWNAFIKFREPSESQWGKRRSSTPLSSIDTNLVELKISDNDTLATVLYPNPGQLNEETLDLSREEVERLLEFQLERMQRYGDLLPDDVREVCQMMLKNAYGVPSLMHFVRFFDFWREGDYTMALENLHRYFDHAMFSHERIYYHYALLHNAILHADFGCFSEAIVAITETIATARENHDISCLNFSLSWLYHLAKAYPRHMKFADYAGSLGTQKEALAYLKLKAKELRIPNLLSSTLLEEAKMTMSAGETISLAFERMYQAANVNTMYNIQHNFSGQLLVQSSIFGRLGFTQIADAYCDIILDCYIKCSPTEEVLRASARNAQSLLQAGKYKSAVSMLEALHPLSKRNLRAHQYLVVSMGVMKLEHSLRLHDLPTADLLLTQLLPSATPIIDSELSFHIHLQKIDYLQRLGSFNEALDLIENLADKLKAEDADIYQRIHVMVLKALLFSRIGKPQKGFSVAMRAANAAWEAKLIPVLWEAWGAVANVLGELKEFEAQKQILDAIIPQAHGGGDVALCAQLYSWQADACMGLAGAAGEDSRLQMSNMFKADGYLDRALKYYKRIEDIRGECDTLRKKSLIASMRGDAALADDWARRYITVYNAHLASQSEEDVSDTES